MSDRKRRDASSLEKENQELQTQLGIFSSSPTVAFIWRMLPDGPRVDYVSPNCKRILGYTNEDFVSGRVLYPALIHPDDAPAASYELTRFLESDLPQMNVEQRVRKSNGQYIWVRYRTTSSSPSPRWGATLCGFAYEITSLKEALNAASTDPLTQLPNHGHFKKSLDLEVKRSRRHKRPTSLIFLDVDDFKSKNDTHGHDAGDRILIEIARRIRQSVREIDLPARYGGEEFVVVLPYTSQEDATVVAERIREAIAGCAFRIGESSEEVDVTASLGLSIYPDDARSAEELVQSADHFMYQAKRAGKNRVCMRTPQTS